MKMYNRKLGRVVEVVKIIENNKNLRAVVWDDYLADTHPQSAGWQLTKMSSLIPMKYYEEHKEEFITPEERADLKKRLKHTNSTWTASDGEVFTDFDKAIIYERSVVKDKIRYLLSNKDSI